MKRQPATAEDEKQAEKEAEGTRNVDVNTQNKEKKRAKLKMNSTVTKRGNKKKAMNKKKKTKKKKRKSLIGTKVVKVFPGHAPLEGKVTKALKNGWYEVALNDHTTISMTAVDVRANAVVPDTWAVSVNTEYPGLTQIASEPAIFKIDDFLSEEEVQRLIDAGQPLLQRAPMLAEQFSGKDTESEGVNRRAVQGGRTSTAAFLDKTHTKWLLEKVAALTNKPIGHMERPQVGHYSPGEWYGAHHDSVDPKTSVGRVFAANGGQRLVTVLIYLSSVTGTGGHTSFPLVKASAGGNLSVTPVQGTAVMFFPGKLNGEPDMRLLHLAEHAVEEKWVSQIWIRQWDYDFDLDHKIWQEQK